MEYRLFLFIIINSILFSYGHESVVENRTEIASSGVLEILNVLTRNGRAANLATCAFSMDTVCFLDVADQYLAAEKKNLIAEAERQIQRRSEGRASSEGTASSPIDYGKKIANYLRQLEEYFWKNWFTSDADDSDQISGNSTKVEEKPKRLLEEARKKKKKGKLHALIKGIIIAIVLFVKFKITLKLLAAGLQIKFFLVALAGLILNAARFWIDLKKAKEPQKVIYYEHAQHQHHYEGGEDDWSSSGPGNSYWGRSYDENENNPQELAYAKQKPSNTKILHKDDENSWFK